MASYEEFRGTGGSLYFLHHQDILTGSERVRIEIHDKASGIVTGGVNLQPNVDYEIDYLQGRVLLSQPLSSTANDNLLVRTSGLSGDEAYLVVRYEYTPGFSKLDGVAVGGQGHYWLNDYVRLGFTADSNEGDSASNLGAADLTLRKSANSWFKLQAGRSTGLLSPSLQSNDGGFGFQGPNDQSFNGAKAGAYRADLSIGLGDFFEGRDGRFTFYTQHLDAGYSSPGEATIKDTEQYGGTFRMPVTSSLSLAAKGDRKIENQGLETRAVELDVAYKLAEKWTVSTGVRNDLRKDNSPVVPLTQIQGERTDAASGGREGNDRIGVGGSYRLTKRFWINGEASDGHLGPGGKVGTSFLYSQRTSYYLNYSLENERIDNGLLLHGSQGNLGYGVSKMQFSSAIEYRRDNAEQLDLAHTETTTWLFRNNFKLQLTPDWRLIGNLDHSVSDSSLGEFYAGGYTEAVVGYAYRPVRNDRLNALVKYTYFYNVPTTGQVGLQNTAAEFLQKSHIAALDVNYDLTANWSLGSKYAYRMGQESLDRVNPSFFDNPAQLAVLRVDWRFLKEWDGLAEVRTLNLPDINQQRRGALAAIYRHISKNLKAGVGYNFTDFSDDLTDLKYNHKGVFVNLIGTM